MKNIIKLLGTKKIVTLSRHSDTSFYDVCMEEISEEDEIKIKQQNKIFNYIRFNTKNGPITEKDIYLFGTVNVEDKNDLAYIEKFKRAILNPYWIGMWYYTSFNYDNGLIFRDKKKDEFLGVNFLSQFETIKWFKYNYCLLGKPKRIIIYKIPTRNPNGK